MTIKQIIASALLCLATTTVRAQQTDAFPYPALPDSLHTPESRARFLLEHYWDNVCFADTNIIHRPELSEQGFVNFIDLLPRISPATTAIGLRAFADHLYPARQQDAAETVRSYFCDLADHYLADEDSPMRNDVLYAQFLDVMAANKFADAAARSRNEFMARNLRKNLPGTTAADFEYVDRQGTKHRLSEFRATLTLLYFYDPDCSHCHETARQLMNIPQLTAGDSIRVLAIYPYEDTDRWQDTANIFPPQWTDGYSPGGHIATNDTYYFKSMPSMYLLDAEKHVLLKNPNISVLKSFISQQKL